MKMNKSRRHENGRGDLTEAKAMSSVLKKITQITGKFLLASTTWRKYVRI